MVLRASSFPTPRAPRSLPGRASVAATSSLLLAGYAVREARRAVTDIRAMRERGRQVPALELDAEFPGWSPVRRMAILGDSSAAGHGLRGPDDSVARRVARALRDADGRATILVCAAVDGADLRAVIGEQVAAAADAEVVLIGVGANDAIRGHGPVRVARETAELLERVRVVAAPEASIILVTAPDLSVAPGLPSSVRRPLGVSCRTTARAQAAVADRFGIAVVALPKESLGPEVFGTDGFHPGQLGHERTAAAILRLLAVR